MFQGIFSAGFAMSLTFWCVQKKGPLFVSIFGPLTLVVVAFVASLILGESLHLGRYTNYLLFLSLISLKIRFLNCVFKNVYLISLIFKQVIIP